LAYHRGLEAVFVGPLTKNRFLQIGAGCFLCKQLDYDFFGGDEGRIINNHFGVWHGYGFAKTAPASLLFI
jgi:hypothetical protein